MRSLLAGKAAGSDGSRAGVPRRIKMALVGMCRFFGTNCLSNSGRSAEFRPPNIRPRAYARIHTWMVVRLQLLPCSKTLPIPEDPTLRETAKPGKGFETLGFDPEPLDTRSICGRQRYTTDAWVQNINERGVFVTVKQSNRQLFYSLPPNSHFPNERNVAIPRI